MTQAVTRPSNAPIGSRYAFDMRATTDYSIVVLVMVVALIIANICAIKPITFSSVPLIGTINTDGGALLFPITYIVGDVLTEVYGFKRARRAIIFSFVAMILATAAIYIVGRAPGADGWTGQESYDAILGFVPTIVIASLVAFVAGEFLNSLVLSRMKRASDGRRLPARLIVSTVFGVSLDTTIFALIAMTAYYQGSALLSYILAGVIFKCLYEVIALPITVPVIHRLKMRSDFDYHAQVTDASRSND